jgi:hypothetical protein
MHMDLFISWVLTIAGIVAIAMVIYLVGAQEAAAHPENEKEQS